MSVMNQISTSIYPNNAIQIYFSQLIGNDSNTGSITSPFATLNAAFSSAIGTSIPVVITGLDGATYNEQLVVNDNLIYLNAPFARLLYSGSGDAITVNTSESGFPLIIGEIGATSGNALVNTSSEIIVATIGSLLGGDIINSGSGGIFLNSDIVTVNFTNTSSGNIYYEVMARLGGTDSAGVFGKSAQGATGPFNIGGYNYPVGGTPSSGYVMTTDGSNNLSLEPISYNSQNWIIPWTAWQYFSSNGTPVFQNYWGATSSENGTVSPAQASWGSAVFNAPVGGIYKFSFAYTSYNGCGIATFIANGITTNVDTYSASAASNSYAWTQALAAGGNSIDLNTLTNNVSSTGYDMQCLSDGLLVTFVGEG